MNNEIQNFDNIYGSILKKLPSIKSGLIIIISSLLLILLFIIGIYNQSLIKTITYVLTNQQSIFLFFLLSIFYVIPYTYIYRTLSKIELALRPLYNKEIKLYPPNIIFYLGLLSSTIAAASFFSVSIFFAKIPCIPVLLNVFVLIANTVFTVAFWKFIYHLTSISQKNLDIKQFGFINDKYPLLIISTIFFIPALLISYCPFILLLFTTLYLFVIKQSLKKYRIAQVKDLKSIVNVNYSMIQNWFNLFSRKFQASNFNNENSLTNLLIAIVALMTVSGFIVFFAYNHILHYLDSFCKNQMQNIMKPSNVNQTATPLDLFFYIPASISILAASVSAIGIFTSFKFELNNEFINLYYNFGKINVLLKSLNWSEITQINVKYLGLFNKAQNLEFKSASGETVLLNLNCLNSDSDKEKILRAIQNWSRVSDLNYDVIRSLTVAKNESHTQVWLEALASPPKRDRLQPLELGSSLYHNQYLIEKNLSVNGQNNVYLAKDLISNQNVVLKEFVLPVFVDISVRRTALEKFENEAKILQQLNHPQIVKIFAYFIEDHRAYLALEYIQGSNLNDLVKFNGPLDEKTVIDIARQVGLILSYLHGLNPPLIHRDLTPDNLLLTENNTVKIIDFNVSKYNDSSSTGSIVGKFAYLPPEQFRGKATIQSDIYALGATLFYLLTARNPEPLSESNPKKFNDKISVNLNNIIIKSTKIKIDERYSNINEFIDDLKHLDNIKNDTILDDSLCADNNLDLKQISGYETIQTEAIESVANLKLNSTSANNINLINNSNSIDQELLVSHSQTANKYKLTNLKHAFIS